VQDVDAKKASAPSGPSKEERREQAARIKKLRIEVGHLEEKVAKLEAQQNELTTARSAGDLYKPGQPQHLNRELSAVVDQLQLRPMSGRQRRGS